MSERTNGFDDGWLDYRVYTVKNIEELKAEIRPESGWEDGYATFSKGECRWGDIPEERRANLWNGKISDSEGYAMELNLWRSIEGVIEEISIERQDGIYFCQYWKLTTMPKVEPNCYYRYAETLTRKPIGKNEAVFKSELLPTIEVIMPDHRLHFFITGRQS